MKEKKLYRGFDCRPGGMTLPTPTRTNVSFILMKIGGVFPAQVSDSSGGKFALHENAHWRVSFLRIGGTCWNGSAHMGCVLCTRICTVGCVPVKKLHP